MKIILRICVFFLSAPIWEIFSESSVERVFQWKAIEYEALPKDVDSNVGPYKYNIPHNTLIASFGYHPASELMIVAFLRAKPGVPLALGAFCVKDYTPEDSVKIWGFPNNQINILRASDYGAAADEDEEFSNIQRIISVFHITVDEKCNRVFFVDTGMLNYNPNGTYVVQKPALWVLELPANGCESRNFSQLRRVEIPDSITEKGRDGFMHVVLDYQPGGACDDLFLYITNTFSSYLVVYDYKNDEFWKFDHETFQPNAEEANFLFEKQFNYQMVMGIISLALERSDENGDRLAYYTPLTGTNQYSVSTKVLKNKSKDNSSNNFQLVGNRGSNHQSLKTLIDPESGVMFYAEVQSGQIRCWNTKKPFNQDNFGVIYEAEDFNFAAQMFIDSSGYLWFHSTKIPIIFATSMPLDLNRINNEIFRVKAKDAIKGTICDNEQE